MTKENGKQQQQQQQPPPVTDEGVNWANLPRAVRDDYLNTVSAGLAGCHKQDTFEVFGTWYTLRTLDPADEGWTLQFIAGGDAYAVGKSKRAPVVAAALVALGPAPDKTKPVEALFKVPADLPEVPKKLIEGSKFFERDWRRTEVLRWLTDPEQHEMLSAVLYDRYLSLERKRNAALEALSPLSKGTRSGGSPDTSSAEQADSSPTPPSRS
jgi:hypothetical protein